MKSRKAHFLSSITDLSGLEDLQRLNIRVPIKFSLIFLNIYLIVSDFGRGSERSPKPPLESISDGLVFCLWITTLNWQISVDKKTAKLASDVFALLSRGGGVAFVPPNNPPPHWLDKSQSTKTQLKMAKLASKCLHF